MHTRHSLFYKTIFFVFQTYSKKLKKLSIFETNPSHIRFYRDCNLILNTYFSLVSIIKKNIKNCASWIVIKPCIFTSTVTDLKSVKLPDNPFSFVFVVGKIFDILLLTYFPLINQAKGQFPIIIFSQIPAHYKLSFLFKNKVFYWLYKFQTNSIGQK